MGILLKDTRGHYTTLDEIRVQFVGIKATKEEQLRKLYDELASVQKEAIAATTRDDRKAAALVGSRLSVLAASVGGIESELHDLGKHLASAEIEWAQTTAEDLEVLIPKLEGEALEANEAVKGAEVQANADLLAARQRVGDIDRRLRDARQAREHCDRTLGNARVSLARLAPVPMTPGMVGLPLERRLARCIAREPVMIDGRLIAAGEEVLIDGVQAAGFIPTVARHAPSQPTPLRDVPSEPLPEGPLYFCGWVEAPLPPPRPDMNIPAIGPTVKIVPAPRKVRVLQDMRLNGRDVVAGEVVVLSESDAAALRGHQFLEAV